MADGYVGDEFVPCEHYTPLHENLIEDIYGDRDDSLTCFCGRRAEYRAKVAFHQKMRADEEYGWGNSITMEHMVDRCEKHRFEKTDD